MTAVRIRDAVLEDAAAIARIHVEGWQHAYVGMVPQALLDSLEVGRRLEMWTGILRGETERERSSTLVSVDGDDHVTGFANVGPARPDAPAPDAAVLYGLYLDPTSIGTGTGRALHAEALQRMRAAGFTHATLDVIPANERARRFYEIAGWRVSGEPQLHAHGEYEIEHQRYAIDL